MADLSLLYLSRADVERAGVTMAEVIERVETAFREKGEGRVEMPPKPGVHPGGADNFIHAMPAYVPALRSAGIKWVGGCPQNPEQGLPYISGLVVLNDVETAVPYAVMDCTWITAMRTGAATAVTARRLARPDSAVLGILGCGVQARTHLEALKLVLPITEVRAYDVVAAAAEAYVSEVGERFGVTAESVSTPRDAVDGCDVVVTAGPIQKQPHRTIQPGWLPQGVFAAPIDYDTYFTPEALHEADKFCTDDVSQLELARRAGYFADIPRIHAEVGELVAGSKAGRESPEERIIAANLGLAVHDMSVAPLVHAKAVERGIGTRLPL